MPTYEFDRIASDMTLHQIIAARRRGKLRIPGPVLNKPGAWENSDTIAERLRALRQALTHGIKPKPPLTHMNRSVLLRRVTEFDARLSRIVKGEKAEDRELTEFAFAPTLIGGVLGSGVGARLSGKKWNPRTGKWEDASGVTSPPAITSAAGAVTGGAAGYGLAKAHQSVMKNYGGAGGTGQAYRNVARNIVGDPVLDKAAAAAAATKKVVPAVKQAVATATPYAQDLAGIAAAEGESALKKLRGAGKMALKKFFDTPPAHLVEFEDRLDAIIFADKKKVVTEFKAQPEEPKKRFLTPGKALIAGVAAVPAIGALTVGAKLAPGAARRVGELVRARRSPVNFAPSTKQIREAVPYSDALKAKFGKGIPPEKVHEFLLNLHKKATGKK